MFQIYIYSPSPDTKHTHWLNNECPRGARDLRPTASSVCRLNVACTGLRIPPTFFGFRGFRGARQLSFPCLRSSLSYIRVLVLGVSMFSGTPVRSSLFEIFFRWVTCRRVTLSPPRRFISFPFSFATPCISYYRILTIIYCACILYHHFIPPPPRSHCFISFVYHDSFSPSLFVCPWCLSRTSSSNALEMRSLTDGSFSLIV